MTTAAFFQTGAQCFQMATSVQIKLVFVFEMRIDGQVLLIQWLLGGHVEKLRNFFSEGIGFVIAKSVRMIDSKT